MLIFTVTLMFLPVDALHAEHENEPGHHCVLVCHGTCHTAEIPVISMAVFSAQSVEKSSTPVFTYENPSLSGLKRPPIVLS